MTTTCRVACRLACCGSLLLALAATGCGRELGEECTVHDVDTITETVVESRNYGCASGICVGEVNREYCTARCESDDDCLEGMHCEDLTFDAIIEDWICMYE